MTEEVHFVRSISKISAWLCTLAVLAACSAGGGGGPSPAAAGHGAVPLSLVARVPGSATGKIEHVVIIFQENRSTDNLFHGLPGADTASSGLDSKGDTIPLHEAPLVEEYDFGHIHQSFLNAYDNGKMDGADKNPPLCRGVTGCGNNAPPYANYAYVPQSDVAEYFSLAEQYAFADRMFQTNQGESYPAHQFIIAGTSAPSVGSDLFVSENPLNGVGCSAPKGATVQLIDPNGDESQTTFPCFEHPTLMDLLDSSQHTWKYYTNQASSIWNAPNSIRHIRFGSDWNDVVIPENLVLSDIANGTLADVSWVNPNAPDSDHPEVNKGTGPSWVASIVNALGSSPYWKNTAVFVTWDDWGGWYDHVAPKIANSYEYGFRVPLIVISPYAKHGYVSHVTHDFGSILKFTEKTFGLATLGYADRNADDLYDCFNFNQSPRPYRQIKTRYDARYFLTHRGPSLPVDTE